MKMHQKWFRSVAVVCLALQLVACGSLLYPERRGQTSGQIDWAVAGMDAVGVLFFLLPGLVAFGVDFYTGAIYLPGGAQGELDSVQKIVIGEVSLEALNLQLSQVLHQDVQLQRMSYQVKTMANEEALLAQLTQYNFSAR